MFFLTCAFGLKRYRMVEYRCSIFDQIIVPKCKRIGEICFYENLFITVTPVVIKLSMLMSSSNDSSKLIVF